jgi:hypothetical protein
MLRKVRDKLRKTFDFQRCISTLKEIILKLGISWKKTKNNRYVEMISMRILPVLPLYNRPVKYVNKLFMYITVKSV